MPLYKRVDKWGSSWREGGVRTLGVFKGWKILQHVFYSCRERETDLGKCVKIPDGTGCMSSENFELVLFLDTVLK